MLFTADTDSAIEKKVKNGEVPSEDIQHVRKTVGEIRAARVDWEVQCFVNEMMKKGRHYVNDQGQIDARDPHKIRRPVNKFRTMLRRLKNAVTFNDPIVDVLPDPGKESDVTPEELDVASWLCLREYRSNNLKSIVKQAVETAALKTWTLLAVTPNDGEDKYDRLTNVQSFDSLDVFFDHPDMSKALTLIISSLETKERLKVMGYDVSKVSDAVNTSHSVSKNRLDRLAGRKQLEGKVLIDQVFRVEYDEKDGKYVPESARVVHFVVAGETAISEKKVLKGYTCLDQLFHVYYLEEDAFDAYNPPWMTDIVPLQRSLNDASENTDTILHAHAKARFKQRLTDSDNLTMLENDHMQVLRYEGAAPEAMDMPNPPEALFRVMATREQQIENQIGQHGPSMGDKEGTQSGRHAALVQAGDQDNVKEPSDTLETALAWMFQRVLEMGAEKIDDIMKLYSPEEGAGEHYVIGADHGEEEQGEPQDAPKSEEEGEPAPKKENARKGQKKRKAGYENAILLRAFKNIQVKVIPGSFFMLAQAKADFMEMLPIMNNLGFKVEARAAWKVMMRTMNLGLSRNISRLVEEEQKKADVLNADYVIAEQEFLKMSNGEPVTATPEQDHEVHLRVKVPGLQALATKYGQDNDAYWTILQNIQQHYQLMQQKKGKAPEAEKAMGRAEKEVAGPAAVPQLPPGGVQEAAAMSAGGAPLPMPA